MSGPDPGQRLDHPGITAEHATPHDVFVPKSLFLPGTGNICLCNLMMLSGFLMPVALFFAFKFAGTPGSAAHMHYLYLRTTGAVLVIGAGLSCLLVLLGVSLSSYLILAGLFLLATTGLLTVARCGAAITRAVRGKTPRNPGSYLI